MEVKEQQFDFFSILLPGVCVKYKESYFVKNWLVEGMVFFHQCVPMGGLLSHKKFCTCMLGLTCTNIHVFLLRRVGMKSLILQKICLFNIMFLLFICVDKG